MRKILSVFVSVTMMLSFFSSIIVYAENGEITFDDYAEQLSQLSQRFGVNSIGGIIEETNPSEISLNRIMVKTNNNEKLDNDYGAVAKIEGYDGIHILQYTSSTVTDNAYDYYNSLSNVEYVEYDFCYRIREPEVEYVDYVYSKEFLSWGSKTVGSNEAITYANYLSDDAPEVVVAVIDTGIDLDHPFFKDRIVDSSIDYVDYDQFPDDDNSHGTHVAGIIVDNTAKNVKISAYKTVDKDGWGYYFLTCAAIDKAVQKGVDVINISLRWENDDGKNTYIYKDFENSILNASNNGIPVIVGAGNEAKDVVGYSPASDCNAIVVAGSTATNGHYEFSNYGDNVDVSAPGEYIKSPVPDNSYDFKSGTSMATPFVSAAAAFLKTLNKNYSVEDIESIIKECVFVPENWDTNYGTGILDFSKISSRCISHSPKITINEDEKAEISYSGTNSVIYYTTDNTDPIAGESNIYTEPIDITEAISIKAIVCENGKMTSLVSTLKINWSEDIIMRYRGKVSMLLPPNREILYCYSQNMGIATPDEAAKTIYGNSVGETKIVVYLDSGQKVTYNVTVEYESWQLFIIYFLFGWLWYI